MLDQIKVFFGLRQRPEPAPIDVAIGVLSGDAAILRGGQVVMTLPAEAVSVMGLAIDEQRAARKGKSRRPQRLAPVDIPLLGDVPTLSDRVAPTAFASADGVSGDAVTRSQ